jgi:hypothetical protein
VRHSFVFVVVNGNFCVHVEMVKGNFQSRF